MSHDRTNPFSNETGEYLQELQESKPVEKEKAEPKQEAKRSRARRI